MNKEWNILKCEELQIIDTLCESINIQYYVARALFNRGVRDFDSAKLFFRPQEVTIPSPFQMKNMEEACDQIIEAIDKNKKILVYGDYDVDGTTAVALVLNYLNKLSSNLSYYIPDRYAEGYGISEKAVDLAINRKVDIFIALDCGITANEKIDKLRNSNIKVIVCDHHLPKEVLPDAIILNPKQKECNYPFKELSGCGVAVKLLEALATKGTGLKEWIDDQLDLLAISIGADMVSVTEENRSYAATGLKLMEQTKNKGLQSLLNLAKLSPPYNMQDIGFGIGPRINAAGRMDHAAKIIDLLVSRQDENIDLIAEQINQDNIERKEVEEQTIKEAMAQLLSENKGKDKFVNIAYSKHWSMGVIGIVASKIQQKIYLPTLVCTQNDEGMITCSARSVQGFSIYDALKECAIYLEKFGGHNAAAGLSIYPEKFDEFSKKLNETIAQINGGNKFTPIIDIDAVLNLNDITAKSIQVIERFEPCGVDNPYPIFASINVKAEGIKVIGKNHLKMWVFQVEDPKVKWEALYFGGIDDYYKLQNRQFNICYQLGFNNWAGKKNIQLTIKDLHF